MPKKSRQKFKYLENEKSFSDEIKSIFDHFWRAIIEANKKKKLEGESPTLSATRSHSYIFEQTSVGLVYWKSWRTEFKGILMHIWKSTDIVAFI